MSTAIRTNPSLWEEVKKMKKIIISYKLLHNDSD